MVKRRGCLTAPTIAMGVVGEVRCRLAKMSSVDEGERSQKKAMVSQLLRQVGASVFFGVSSVLIITVNKTVLTTYKLVVPAYCVSVLINAQSHRSH